MPFLLPFPPFYLPTVGRFFVFSLRGNSRRASPRLTPYFQVKEQKKQRPGWAGEGKWKTDREGKSGER